jgi:magnesium transporter
MYDPLLLPELREMMLENDAHGMHEFCEVLHPAQVAENLEALTNDEIWHVLSYTSVAKQGEIFEFINLERQKELVATVDQPRLSLLIEQMAPDDRVDLLKKLDMEQVERLLPLVAAAERQDIRRLLSYPEHSAGSIMTTEYATLPENISVGEAIQQLRQQAPNRETIYYIYVVDEERHLRGLVSLRKLILAKVDTPLSKIIERDVISVRVDDDQEKVAQTIARYDFIALPVVDDQNRMVGIITHDDALDVMQQEATEDINRMGAVGTLEQSYLTTPFFTLAWKRGLWLVVLFGAAFLTSSILNAYQDVSAMYPWIVAFIPLVIASGGNAGSQSATLVIRTLALGESRPDNWHHIVWREIRMGLLLGLALGAVGFLPALVLTRWHGAVVVSSTVILVVTLGTLIGSLLPMAFRRMGMDPALMSNPLIAALSDFTGIILYYSLVIVVLGTKA